jgi:hypothetical protein
MGTRGGGGGRTAPYFFMCVKCQIFFYKIPNPPPGNYLSNVFADPERAYTSRD